MDSNTNFQEEKLQLIQLLLNTQNPKTISEVKSLLTKTSLPPLTQEDLMRRADESEQAIRNDETLTIEELSQEVKTWI